jgi:hypothetical protein
MGPLVRQGLFKEWQQIRRPDTSRCDLGAVDQDGPVLAAVIDPQNLAAIERLSATPQERRFRT